MSTRRPALGRGLSALIPNAGVSASSSPSTSTASPTTLRVDQVEASRVQPRTQFEKQALQQLADSITANGILQPIIVRRGKKGRYLIIAGERRYRAAQMSGLTEVPVVVRDATEAQAYELALVENIQRQDLDAIEEALAYRHLVQHYGMTQDAVAKRVGKDRTTVANALRLLKLPEKIQSLLVAGQLTAGHARAVLTAPEPSRLALATKAVVEAWSVRETERQAKAIKEVPEQDEPDDESPPAAPSRSPADVAVEDQLRSALGAPVKLSQKRGKGRIEIRFHSLDELERLIELLSSLEGI